MKESVFIENNQADWEELERILEYPDRADADKLIFLFEKVSGDLAFARTFYPNRSVRVYLNNLTQNVLKSIETKRNRFKFSDIITYYREELPREVYRSRKAFITSFLVFVLAVVIGVISSANVEDFPNIILGDDYIQMTEDNINDGDPMAVYKDMDQGDMFLKITINNVRVSFLCFVLGILGSMGTVFVLLYNGIMVGAFQYFFYKKGLFLTSFLTIWIHGTIEISAIIIAGAAGIILGNGILFPKSYDRQSSTLMAAKRALKIILGIIPLFIIAGFLESFVTRLTDMPMILKILIIGGSLFFILLVFVVYPIAYGRSQGVTDSLEDQEEEPIIVENLTIEKNKSASFFESLSTSFALLRMHLGSLIYHYLLPATLFIASVLFFILKFHVLAETGISYDMDLTKYKDISWIYGVCIWMCISYLFILMMMKENGIELKLEEKLKFIKQHFLQVALTSLAFTIIYFYWENQWIWILALLIPVQFYFIVFDQIPEEGSNFGQILGRSYSDSWRNFISFLPVTFLFFLSIVCIQGLINSPLVSIFTEFAGWHDIFGNFIADAVFIEHILRFIAYTFPLILFYYMYVYFSWSLRNKIEFNDLYDRFEKFGSDNKISELT